jgi:hypothetical protein
MSPYSSAHSWEHFEDCLGSYKDQEEEEVIVAARRPRRRRSATGVTDEERDSYVPPRELDAPEPGVAPPDPEVEAENIAAVAQALGAGGGESEAVRALGRARRRVTYDIGRIVQSEENRLSRTMPNGNTYADGLFSGDAQIPMTSEGIGRHNVHVQGYMTADSVTHPAEIPLANVERGMIKYITRHAAASISHFHLPEVENADADIRCFINGLFITPTHITVYPCSEGGIVVDLMGHPNYNPFIGGELVVFVVDETRTVERETIRDAANHEVRIIRSTARPDTGLFANGRNVTTDREE